MSYQSDCPQNEHSIPSLYSALLLTGARIVDISSGLYREQGATWDAGLTVASAILGGRFVHFYNCDVSLFLFQNSMNLPPDKARLLRQYDNEKKWELICDQVGCCLLTFINLLTMS